MVRLLHHLYGVDALAYDDDDDDDDVDDLILAALAARMM